MDKNRSTGFLFAILLVLSTAHFVSGVDYVSALGDPGMRRDGLRLAIESWNQCNEVGEEVPQMGSPRAADCFDIYKAEEPQTKDKNCSMCNFSPYTLVHKVTEDDNKLGIGDTFHGMQPQALYNADLYAAEKELYLGSKCEVEDVPNPWQFWMIMLKNGNMDTLAAKCPWNGQRAAPFVPDGRFPCFGIGCMNQPLIYHEYTTLQGPNGTMLKGRFFGSWDLDADLSSGLEQNRSYYSVTWQKEISKGSWIFHHTLRTSIKYPWLMLYLRSDATSGFSGGYHYPTRGIFKIIPESPNFKVRFTLNVLKGGGNSSQFYLIDIGSCWKNNGKPCDGDVSNPQPQEILQILPHPVWGEYGYPTNKGEGWIGSPKTWELDVGRLSQSLYFYQDPGTSPARRQWTSIDLGTEIFKDPQQIAEWTVSDFDILIPKQ
ncbi:hypothetical protein PIB30_022309 [Stylosanthes scabra]|uniref:DUF7705 domain-containing protein n=1 Tax=Stylosanthes scabra TaxID=79078 RepID=A0ABU6U843_9FABA|nr:hypothetical protein [Stylosanthes scabra]